MVEYPVSEARADLQAVIAKARKQAVCITKHGKPDVVVLSHSLYEQMLDDLEDAQDIAAIDEAMKDVKNFIPWEKVKKELGLV
jgi:prevent-host-death family protein